MSSQYVAFVVVIQYIDCQYHFISFHLHVKMPFRNSTSSIDTSIMRKS